MLFPARPEDGEFVLRAQAIAALEEAEELLEFKGMRDGDLHAALSQTCDVLVTGDTNLQDQQNLVRYDLAIVVLHPQRLVIDQIKPLIPLAIAAFATAPKHAVMTIRADETLTGETTA